MFSRKCPNDPFTRTLSVLFLVLAVQFALNVMSASK